MLKNNEPGAEFRAGASHRRRRRIWAGLVAVLSLALVTGTGLLTTAPPAQADITDGLLLQYKLDETSGTVAHDSSGYGRDGTVNGTADLGGDQGLGFNGSDTYVKLPDNVMAGLNSISVDFDVWIDPSLSTPYFFYGLGNTSNTSGNGYLFTTGDTFRTSVSMTDYTAKQDIQPSGAAYELPRGTWEHVTYTQTGHTGIMYENGVEKARNTNVTITPGAIGGGTTIANYLGKSLYAYDKYFKGRMRDFRLYNKSLSPAEVEDRSNTPAEQWEQLQALAEYNGALAAFEDPKIGPVVIFPSDYTGDIDNVQRPPDWTDSSGQTPTLWPTPTTARSPMFTAAQIGALQDAVYAAIQPDSDTTYDLTVHYDGMSDRVVVQTNAPSSVTDPLASQYAGKLVIDTSADTPPSPSACTPAQAGVTKGLLLDYKLDESFGTVAHDSSGYGRDGTVNGTADLGGDQGLGFNGSDTYVKLPDNVMAGLNSISVDFDVWIDPDMGTPYFFYGLGNTSNTSGNGYLFTTGDTFRTSVSMTDYTAKQDIQPSGAAYELPRGTWEHVTYTQTGHTGIMYENGVEKARNTNVTITPGAIGGGTTIANYLGRSLYAYDKYFKGRMRDFRLYDHALTPTEVENRADEPAEHWEQLQELADYNCALAYFDDPDIGPVIIFPSDYAGDFHDLQTPSDWTDSSGRTPTSWPTPTTAKSPMFTAAQIKEVTDAAYAKITPDGNTTYSASVRYDGMSDRIVVVTNAPSSVTGPLLSTYPGRITLQAPPA